jgi:hypothetical protein
MAMQIVQNAKLFFDGYNLSGDMSALALDYGAELKDATVLGDQSLRRRAGLKSLKFNHEGFWNGGVGNVDDALFSEIGVADKPMTICPLTGAEGELCFFFDAAAAQYNPGAAVGDMFKFSVAGEMSDGSDLARGIVGVNGTKVATGNGTVFTLGAVGANQKLYAALHVLAPVAGVAPTLDVIVQSAVTNFATITTRATFSQKNAIGSQSIAPLAGPITDTFWRVAWTIGGSGGPSFPFVVVLAIQ